MDLGVHKNLQIEQDEYCFDVCMDETGASLLINSKEQILTEKLRSLLKFGPLSTRYKDVFDICYLSDYVDTGRLAECLDTYIINDPGMKESGMEDIIKRVRSTFSNRLYRRNIARAAESNWLDIPIEQVLLKVLAFLESISAAKAA